MTTLQAVSATQELASSSQGIVGIPTTGGGVRWYSQGAYTVEQAGRLFLGMSRAAAFKAAEEGRIPTVRVSPRRLMVTAQALDRLLHPEDYLPPVVSAVVGVSGSSTGLAVAG